MAKKTTEEIALNIKTARKIVDVGALYFHYKNPKQFYIVEFIGCLENSEEICVGYRALYGKGILWVRTLENFLSKLDIEGQKVDRFTRAN